MNHPLRLCISIFYGLALLVLLLPESVFAQKKKKNNLGKEFYVAFAENQGSGDETQNFFALFITSKVPTTGTVEVPAIGFNQKFNTTPGAITTVELTDGKNRSQFLRNGTLNPNYDPNDPTVEITVSEQVLNGMAVHITSNDDITVYGMSHKEYSSDAFMTLRIAAL